MRKLYCCSCDKKQKTTTWLDKETIQWRCAVCDTKILVDLKCKYCLANKWDSYCRECKWDNYSKYVEKTCKNRLLTWWVGIGYKLGILH